MKIMFKCLSLLLAPYRFIYKEMFPTKYARSIGVSVGENCRLIDVSFGSEPYLVRLGNYVSATSTRFITHDGSVWVYRLKHPGIDLVAPITVGDNVFIGAGSIILPGVSIGNNVIIGAGSVVSRDIPEGYVAAGVPAKPIQTLDLYWEKISNKVIQTKSMTKKQKEEFLKKHFNL